MNYGSAGVAEWLGGGLQIMNSSGNPYMLVRIRSPAPNIFVVCLRGDLV